MLGHVAVGTWSGGRFMRFGEPISDARLEALLRPGGGIDTVMSADAYGAGEADALLGRALAGVSRADYRLVASTDRFGAVLSAADLALSRAGGTVWELANAGVPAVLVPYPHATGDHQTLNARHFERGGGAVVVPDAELDRVPELIRSLLGDAERLERMAAAMRALARPHAADEIAEELVALARA